MGCFSPAKSESKPEVISARRLYDPDTYKFITQRAREGIDEDLANLPTYDPWGGRYGVDTSKMRAATEQLGKFDTTVPTYGAEFIRDWQQVMRQRPSWLGRGQAPEIEGLLSSAKSTAERFYGEERGAEALAARKGGYAGGGAQRLETDIGKARLAGQLGEFEANIRYKDVAQRRELETKFMGDRMRYMTEGTMELARQAEARGEFEVAKKLEAQALYVDALYSIAQLDERELERQIEEFARAQELTAEQQTELTRILLAERVDLLRLLRGEVATSGKSTGAGALYPNLTLGTTAKIGA